MRGDITQLSLEMILDKPITVAQSYPAGLQGDQNGEGLEKQAANFYLVC